MSEKGLVIDFSSGLVTNEGKDDLSVETHDGQDRSSSASVNRWHTGIGTVLSVLSTPRPGERAPLHRVDASILLEYLLSGRVPDHWDDSACRRIRAEIIQRMACPLPVNNDFVRDKLELVLVTHSGTNAPEDRRRTQPSAGTSEPDPRTRWVQGPLETFERAIRDSYASRDAYLNDTHFARLRAVFVACLFEANAVQTLTVVTPRVPAPPLFPATRTNDPSRYRK
jgi:hypothetical protein